MKGPLKIFETLVSNTKPVVITVKKGLAFH